MCQTSEETAQPHAAELTARDHVPRPTADIGYQMVNTLSGDPNFPVPYLVGRVRPPDHPFLVPHVK